MPVNSRSDSSSHGVNKSPTQLTPTARTSTPVRAQPVNRYQGAPISGLSQIAAGLAKASPGFKQFIVAENNKRIQ